jgi:hypothetical protein
MRPNAIVAVLLTLLVLAVEGRSQKVAVGGDLRPPATAADLPKLPDARDMPWGKEVDGLACRVIVAPEITHGQPLRLAVEIRNNGQRPRFLFEVFDPYFRDQAQVQIVGPGGPIAQTSWAQTSLSPQRFKPLAPGETRRFDFVDLRELYGRADRRAGWVVDGDGFRKEGKYTLTYSYKGPKLPDRVAVGEKIVERGGLRTVEKVYEEPSAEQKAGAWAGTLTSNSVTFMLRPLVADDLAVHEWGVFTVFSDIHYANLNREAEWGSLPPDFYRQFPRLRLRWVPAAWDKPVVYFYTKQPMLKVRTQVRFTEGAPVVWWPACSQPLDDNTGNNVRPDGRPVKPYTTLVWDGWLGGLAPSRGFAADRNAWVKAEEFPLPRDCWLHDARLKDAALITVTGSQIQRGKPWTTDRAETERFLFYDGLMPAPDCLRCIKTGEAGVTVKNQATFALEDLFVIDRRHRRADAAPLAAAMPADPLAAGQQVELKLEPATPERLRTRVRQALLRRGLFEAEADSLLKIWHKGFFENEGLTVLSLLPQAEYDRMLPLEITPAPAARPVRVGVVLQPRFEHGPIVAARAAELIKQLDADDFDRREAASKELEAMGLWVVRAVQDALKGKTSVEQKKRLEAVLEKLPTLDWLQPESKPAPKGK